MDHRWADLAQTLRSLGLWRPRSEDDANAAEREVVEVQWPFGSFGDEPGGFWFFVDGEEMAEGFVGRELADMAPRLREHGVDLRIEEVSFPRRVGEGNYVVAINGRRCVVWTAWLLDPRIVAAIAGFNGNWIADREFEQANGRP